MTGAHDELLEVPEAMAMLRIRDRHDIYKLIKAGKLHGVQRVQPGGKWLITLSSVEALMQPGQP